MTSTIQPAFTASSLFRRVLTGLVTSAVLVGGTTPAAAAPEQACRAGRYDAAARYSACQHKALSKYFGTRDFAKYQAAAGKCQTKYAAVWPKLRAKAPGSTCDVSRFVGNGMTVTDNLTGLQWETKKNLDSVQNPGDPHDADNEYTWSVSPPAATGSVFTSFLPELNSGGCFAGQCDWRLPTLYELQTILLAPPPCGTSPCIDPVFGPTDAKGYWSATTDAEFPDLVWDPFFGDGTPYSNYKPFWSAVRAVRAGL